MSCECHSRSLSCETPGVWDATSAICESRALWGTAMDGASSSACSIALEPRVAGREVNHHWWLYLQSGVVDAHEPRRQPPDWLELRELRYFLAVAEELNFTRAAERVHLAQQALSASIRNLEADLGVQLFTRSTRHVALTAAGEALVASARHVLESAAEAVDEVKRVGSGQAGRLIIGFSTAAGSVPRVRDVIRRFSQAVPDVDVRLVEYDLHRR
jgi:Bacterial regulatory helix-turn-helix protein, lysR family